MKSALTVLLLIHGSIHFMGFVKAFEFANVTQLTNVISRPMGLLWALTGLLYITCAVFFLLKKEGWILLAIAALVLSQILIIGVWTDAKYGTFANVIILIAAIIGIATRYFENNYLKDVREAMQSTKIINEPVTEKDLEPLPPIVQKYLNYVGVVGKPKVFNVKIIFEGQMREKGQEWFDFTSEQYNFIHPPTRLFFMNAKVKGIPTHGYHAYKPEGASMLIKLLSLYPVVDIKSKEMFTTETVTFFNDICLFAPSMLIDSSIQWETIDPLTVKAIFTNDNTSISAILHFIKQGQLVNFVSNDRISVSEMKTFPFSTPAKDYKDYNEYKLCSYGEATWHYPEGDFVYGKFTLKEIAYNVSF